ncbi:hypothetical protein BJY01DRAFT_253811 [Aspergillus pseudoustus]|uniref:Uncharacterized protein n=1 Tax=Aspergillus pseudoustus TaxID=1810923 RepID=A0ABR4IY46_9EURO
MADIPGLDEFAQTRGADDLFDDEIIPVAVEEQQQQPPAQQYQQPPEPPAVDQAGTAPALDRESTPARTETPPRQRGGERRGRGRGRGGRGGRGAQTSGSRRSDAPNIKTEEGATESEPQNGEEKPAEAPVGAEQPSSEDAAAAPADAPRVPAVRGDRSATGGVKKPKLTEEELSQRMAAARENAAKKAAAHARAQADQASFMEREKIAEKKRREERANRRVMDTERERNRLRKLEALGGREWDADKPEEQFSSRGGRGQFRRGMHGGVSGYTRRGFEDSQTGEDSPDSNASQPHGHRGRGRGRGGRGRGSHRGPHDRPSEDKSSGTTQVTPVITNEAEFPSLPGAEKKETPAGEPTSASDDKTKPLSPISGATWADQVEASRE